MLNPALLLKTATGSEPLSLKFPKYINHNDSLLLDPYELSETTLVDLTREFIFDESYSETAVLELLVKSFHSVKIIDSNYPSFNTWDEEQTETELLSTDDISKYSKNVMNHMASNMPFESLLLRRVNYLFILLTIGT